MTMLIAPRHCAHSHALYGAPMISSALGVARSHEGVFSGAQGIGGFVDSGPKTLVPSASNRSTPEWTLADSVDSRQRRVDGQLRASGSPRPAARTARHRGRAATPA